MIPSRIHAQTLRTFLEPVGPLLDDTEVSEILINGPDEIYAERRGKLVHEALRFDSHAALMSALTSIAQRAGRPLGPQHPVLEASLPDGSRVEAVLPPAAPDGPTVAIRRFPRERLTIERLVALNALDEDTARLLEALVACKQNILVAGGTGSGKTSLLNVLSSFIAQDERIVVIEDARELQLQRSHVVQLEAVPGDARGRGRIGSRDLLRATLRLRPDRIVMGEVRGSEALELVQAMTSGHEGCLSTIHATHPADALRRLETMCLMSDVELPLPALRAQILSAIDVVVQTARLRDGSRRITLITEVLEQTEAPGFRLRDLCVRRISEEDATGRRSSRLQPSGLVPSCNARIREAGLRLPAAFSESPAQASERRT